MKTVTPYSPLGIPIDSTEGKTEAVAYPLASHRDLGDRTKILYSRIRVFDAFEHTRDNTLVEIARPSLKDIACETFMTAPPTGYKLSLTDSARIITLWTLHVTSGFLLKPTLQEVVAQIPDDIVDEVCASPDKTLWIAVVSAHLVAGTPPVAPAGHCIARTFLCLT